jgi:mannose-6-phosphate isomerase-like protein (cupin superfamily)
MNAFRAIASVCLFTITAGALAATTVVANAFEPFYSIGGQHQVIHPSGANDEILAMQEQTDGQLGIVTLDGDGPGANIVHASRAEYWYVLEGTYEFTLGDKKFEGGPGTFVATPAKTPHNIHLKSGPGRFLVIFSPGGYEHFFMDWEKQKLSPGPELGALENQHGLTRP